MSDHSDGTLLVDHAQALAAGYVSKQTAGENR